ncbi:unnamed protein product [Angiostrongylus costaricensis]|uniref:Peptidase S1 domain-containing protein n=1 Tax=Angiostrongylus costaricensis TaxID=334426 RepID=A0A158PIK3_ANGCS|nr:unnamed protein product [Angiostrongylus costaricensis]
MEEGILRICDNDTYLRISLCDLKYVDLTDILSTGPLDCGDKVLRRSLATVVNWNIYLATGVKTRQKRMMNGTPVKKGDMKYAVMLDIGNGKCLSPFERPRKDLVISASDGANIVYVHYGGHCVVVKPDGHCPEAEVARRVKAIQMIVPARYFMSKCRSGDIAIVELETALPESTDYYDIACLPTRRVKLSGRNLTSAGYGYDPDNVAATEKHMEKIIYSKEPFCDPSIKVGKDAFCVVEKGQFACKGDSGSGVMQPANKLRDYVMGVLAIGLNCNDVQVRRTKRLAVSAVFSVGKLIVQASGYVCGHAYGRFSKKPTPFVSFNSAEI